MNTHDNMPPIEEERWTAYALGEVGEDERLELERRLAESESARALLAEVQETAALLEQALAAEPCPGLSEAQEQAILDQAAQAPRIRRQARMYARTALALAASLLLVVGGAVLLRHTPAPSTPASPAPTLSHLELAQVKTVAPEQVEPGAALVLQNQVQPVAEPRLGVPAEVELVEVPQSAPTNAQPGDESLEVYQSVIAVPRLGDSQQAPELLTNTGTETHLWIDSAKGDSNAATFQELSGGGGGYGGGAYGGGGLGGGLVGGEYDINGDGTSDHVFNTHYRAGVGGFGGGGYGGGERAALTSPESAGSESYAAIAENTFQMAAQQPLSTFSIDLDTASYANVRRFLSEGQLPPKDAVRIEELINYFAYDYAPPSDDKPFAAHVEVTACPWTPEHRLVRLGLKGKEIAQDGRKPCNLVFLLDVSGSMQESDKLPLLQKAMKTLLDVLTKNDRVAIVTFREEARLHLSPTTCDQKQVILAAIDELRADGGTNGGAGLDLAYDLATEHLLADGVNRVIVGTDGDFNVGVTDRPELVQRIQERAKAGVFLTVLGFGRGNLQDANLECLADKGNGSYHYIDTFNEARRVLCEGAAGALITIAKDVKVQVEFNPGKVLAYRLIGYENRVLAARDFNDDRKDAGEIGSGHTVTALYEVVPVGVSGPLPGVDPLRFQKAPEAPANLTPSNELLVLKLRYKAPDGDTSQLTEIPVADEGTSFENASGDTRFVAAVAAFGMLLRDSDAKGAATYDLVGDWVRQGKGPDPSGHRSEFLNLIDTAKTLAHH